MEPWLHPGEIICGLRIWLRLKVGDIVVVRQGGLEKIKRIDKIEGKKLFVTGDNAPQSTDSRHFGWLDVRDVRAKVFWPHR